MPIDAPKTYRPGTYEAEAQGLLGPVRVALTVGEKGETLAEIGDMVMEGAVAFSDDGHGVQSAGMMRTCMEYVSQFDRVVSAHCEIESLTTHGVINEGRASTRLGMFGWPALGDPLTTDELVAAIRGGVDGAQA